MAAINNLLLRTVQPHQTYTISTNNVNECLSRTRQPCFMFCSSKLGLQTLRSLAAESANWKSRDIDGHPALKRAMIEQGYGDMLAELKMEEVMGSFWELLEKTGEKTEELKKKIQKEVDKLLGGNEDAPEEATDAIQNSRSLLRTKPS